MRIRMLVGISGGRADGTEWPAPGGELDVSDREGVELCAAGLAVPVAVPDGPVETPERPAVDVEERATGETSTAGLPKRAPRKK